MYRVAESASWYNIKTETHFAKKLENFRLNKLC